MMKIENEMRKNKKTGLQGKESRGRSSSEVTCGNVRRVDGIERGRGKRKT